MDAGGKMYEELINRLRKSADQADRYAVMMCKTEGAVSSPLMREAADAIEELVLELGKTSFYDGMTSKEKTK